MKSRLNLWYRFRLHRNHCWLLVDCWLWVKKMKNCAGICWPRDSTLRPTIAARTISFRLYGIDMKRRKWVDRFTNATALRYWRNSRGGGVSWTTLTQTTTSRRHGQQTNEPIIIAVWKRKIEAVLFERCRKLLKSQIINSATHFSSWRAKV